MADFLSSVPVSRHFQPKDLTKSFLQDLFVVASQDCVRGDPDHATFNHEDPQTGATRAAQKETNI